MSETAFDVMSFDAIRPYYDHEVNEVVARLLNDESYLQLARVFFPGSDDDIKAYTSSINSNLEFQAKVVYPAIQNILENSSDGLTCSGIDRLDPKQGYLFISNHRDIILDSALINNVLYENGHNTTEIAIGNNLLTQPWIKDLVKLNKSFIVHRDVSPRQLVLYSQRLSNYIRHNITERMASVWIAQKEGRTKDGNDQTHAGLLKMFGMGGSDFIADYKALNIVPVSLSYEYDPCDALKVEELHFQDPNITVEEDQVVDMNNMITGVKGRKGKIHIAFGTPIQQELDALKELNKNEQFKALASLIDAQIYRNYVLYPCNYIAADMLNEPKYTDRYTVAERAAFHQYIEQQANTLPHDRQKVVQTLVEMYAYPVWNQGEVL